MKAAGKGCREHHLAGASRHIQETAHTQAFPVALAYIHIAVWPYLEHPQHAQVQGAAVIHVEFVRHLNGGLRVPAAPEVMAAGRNPANAARLGGKGDVIPAALFRRNRGNCLRYAHAQVHDGALGQFHGSPSGNYLPGAELFKWDGIQWNPYLT